MRFLAWLLVLVLVTLGGVLGALTLGVFASLVSDAPLWLRSLGSLEATISGSLGALRITGFRRALILAVLTSAVLGLAAYIKPRA